MSSSTLTPHIAPRSPQELALVSPYQLRTLAEKVGAFATDAQKMAWHTLTNEQRASEVARLLGLWDQQNPGAYAGQAAGPPPQQQPPQGPPPSAAPPAPPPQQAYAPPGSAPPQGYGPPTQTYAPPTPPPVQQYMPPGVPAGVPGGIPMGIPGGGVPTGVPGMYGPPAGQPVAPPQGYGTPQGYGPMGGQSIAQPMQQMPMPGTAPAPGAPPQVDPQTVAAAQAAAAPPATTGKGKKGTREPVAPATPPPATSPDLGSEVINLLNRLIETGAQTHGSIQAFSKTLEEAASGKESRITVLETAMKDFGQAVQNIDHSLRSVNQTLAWLLILNLNTVAREHNVSIVQVLTGTIRESEMFQQIVQHAQAGLGKAG